MNRKIHLKIWEWYGKLTIRGSHDLGVPGITREMLGKTVDLGIDLPLKIGGWKTILSF